MFFSLFSKNFNAEIFEWHFMPIFKRRPIVLQLMIGHKVHELFDIRHFKCRVIIGEA